MSERTVPDELLGCWQRNWIEFADGTRDDTSFVVWLQLPTLMADIRLSAAAVALAGRSGFDECSWADLLSLAGSDSSSGSTACTLIALGADGVPRATAEWTSSVSFQPESAYPEPGLLEWRPHGAVLIERAPSGAYVEQWQLLPGSRGEALHSVLDGGAEWYRSGDVGVLVRARSMSVPTVLSVARLTKLTDRRTLETLLDCEFSFARRIGDAWLIEASTL
ncbi:MAG: hypothetical protein WCC60_18710, partial [Ilumatobacteraceae bacterium]